MAEKIQFFLLDLIYKIIEGIPYVFLYGKDLNNRQICIVDKSFKPYFFVLLENPDDAAIFQEKIRKIEIEHNETIAKVMNSEIVEKSYLGVKKNFVKVYVRSPKDVPLIRNAIKEWDMIKSIHEYDIHFVRRYLIDKQITPMNLVEAVAEPTSLRSKVPIYETSSVTQTEAETLKNPKVLSFDIETYNPLGKRFVPEEHPIIMIAFYGDGFKRVITWKKFKTKDKNIEFVKGEVDLINRFKDILEEYKPDILTGYFSDGFDFPYIITRAKKYKINLDIGLDFSALSVARGRTQNVAIVGITHLDIFKFVSKNLSRSLETDSYDLDSVSAELLGENKHSVDLDNLTTVWDTAPEELEKYCKYNIQDAELTFKLAVKLLPQIKELVKIVGLPIYDVTRMAFSQMVEWYLMKRVQEFNGIAPNKPNYDQISERRRQTYKGAFVFEPVPGLYNNLAVFDFRSLYPSIISSHNIGLNTFNCSCCMDSEHVPDEKYWFCKNKRGFIPQVVEELITRRLRVKEMIKEKPDIMLDARSESLKLLSNAFYGYLGFYASRWYCLECAKSITAYGRYYINKVIEKAKTADFKVLYADSITKDRFIVLLDKEGIVHIKNVEDFFKEHIKRTKKIADKEVIYFDNYKSLTVDPLTKKVKWERLKSIIRHKNTKKIFRVNQKYGETKVTEDHSIISSDGKKFIELKPTQISDKNHFVKIVKIPPLKKIDQIDVYETLKDYKYNAKYKGRIKTATVHADSKWIWFGWTNRKNPVKVKRFIKVGSEDFNALCRLLGAYIPEGSSSTPETTKSRLGANISTSDVKLLEELQKDYHRLFDNAKASLIRSQKNIRILKYENTKGLKKITYEDKTYKLQMMNNLSAVFFKMFCGQKSTGKKLPWFIFHVDDKYKKIILDKLIERDGSRSVNKNLGYSEEYKKNFFRYTTKSLELVSGLSFLLSQLNQKYSIRYRQSKECYTITTSSKFNKKFKTDITEEEYKGYVYDLEVEKSHMFVDACGQILLHNTDSIFLALESKSKEDALSFVEKINKNLPEMMELEHEGFYPSGIFVSAKEGPYGAKKRYALLDEEGMVKIKGFEMVRRNVSFIAKEVQEEILNIILKENNPDKAVKYVRKVIQKLRDKEIENDKVVIFTQISKDLSDYEAVGPHVAVAKKMKARGVDIGAGSLIKFIIVQGSGIIRDRARIPEEVDEKEYDAEYYIKHQVIPAVEKIFAVLGFSKNDLLESKDQSKLESFF